jgi:hypothetical protein
MDIDAGLDLEGSGDDEEEIDMRDFTTSWTPTSRWCLWYW